MRSFCHLRPDGHHSRCFADAPKQSNGFVWYADSLFWGMMAFASACKLCTLLQHPALWTVMKRTWLRLSSSRQAPSACVLQILQLAWVVLSCFDLLLVRALPRVGWLTSRGMVDAHHVPLLDVW